MKKDKRSPTIYNVQGLNPLKNMSFIISSVLSIIVFIISYFTDSDILYTIISSLTPVLFSILLVLVSLGMTIYAIIWGFSQHEVLEILLKIPTSKREGYSQYQYIISVFGFSVLIYFYSLSITSIIYAVSELSPVIILFKNDIVYSCLNKIGITLLFFSTIYSLLLFHDTIHSTFSFIDIYKVIVENKNKGK